MSIHEKYSQGNTAELFYFHDYAPAGKLLLQNITEILVGMSSVHTA